MRKRFRNSVKQCRTFPGADINSDHNPLLAKLSIRLKKITKKKQDGKLEIDWGKLQTQEERDKFNVEIRNRYEVLCVEGSEQVEQEKQEDLTDHKWEWLKESMKMGMEKAPKKERIAKQPWMTKEILDLMSERKKVKNTPKYKNIDTMIIKKCKEAKEKWISNKCEEITEYDTINQTKKLHNSIKELTGKKRHRNAIGGIKNKDGKMLFQKDDILQRWTEYIAELFKDDRPPLPKPSNNDGPPILQAEVENAIRKTPTGKTPGEDGISTEMIKLLDEYGIGKLLELYNRIYESGHIPEQLLKSMYIILPKKPKASECGDFRTISLMPHTMKIFLKIILERISNKSRKTSTHVS